ncbi:3'(2'),5'-bisphosphate nucleotidase CysQ [Shewanella salipaludis]|uniref:3'(2'),5'-bisphosphate nucleotidase CysQ n=1 Tax=Shewanella salipaludis TaxID=2723052 RepID=A0A972FZ44_9GAMM|nr:3'(2'),5'-bisphosphate nucleotidase CysQ [Shewanella salipaludis]
MTSEILSREQLDQVAAIALQAGEAILRVYGQTEVQVAHKADASPVTAADIASHESIVAALTRQFPQYPVMSEEAADIPWEVRRHWSTYWLIDPLDGTKEFLKRNGEFTVNIALIHQGRAIAGVVYAPVLDKCYLGSLASGAWLVHQGETIRLDGAGKTDAVRPEPIVVGSRSHASPGLAAYLEALGAHSLLSVGSSLKFCLLAEGAADIYPRLGPTSEWDTAAAQAVLEAAGGRVTRYGTDEPLKYNQKAEILNPYFIATAPGWAK